MPSGHVVAFINSNIAGQTPRDGLENFRLAIEDSSWKIRLSFFDIEPQ